MPYNALPPAWIEAGKPTKEEIFQYIRDNQESFNIDIEALKQTATVDMINTMVGGEIGNYSEAEIQDRLPVFCAPVAGSITSVVMRLLEASGAGTISLELEKSTDNGATWSPLLSSPVTLTGTTAGSISGAVSFISIATQAFNQNDLIRPVLSTVKATQGNFHISVYGEVS